MKTVIVTSALAMGLLASLVAADTKDKKPTGVLFIAPAIRNFSPAPTTEQEKAFAAVQEKLVGKHVLVTLMRDGKPYRQREFSINRYDNSVSAFRELPHGRYSVRFEGEGIETLVKGEYLVTDQSEPIVKADLIAGKGVRVIRYGDKEDPIEALQARVKKLEALVEKLLK